MADNLAVGTESADRAAGAIDEGGLQGQVAAEEARDPITKKRRTRHQEVPMDTDGEAAEEIVVTVQRCTRFVPDVPLEVFYQQMKLGLESFSSWWKKQFPANTYEEDIQRAFEMYRLNVTEADLAILYEHHAHHIPFTLTDDLGVKRRELIDAVALANKRASAKSLDEEMKSFKVRARRRLTYFRRSSRRSLVEIGTIDAIGTYEDHLKPGNLKRRRRAMEQRANQQVAEAQAALINFGTEYLFWDTMSRFRPRCIIGAGAITAGARDTPDEQAFQIESFIYYEKAKLGFEEFKSWAKDHFAPAPHPRFDDNAIQILFDMLSLELAKETAKTIEEKMETTAQLMEAQERWRAAIGVPLDFDDVRKKLLSTIKDAKMKASAANLDKRIACYLSAINKKIACFDRLIARLSLELEQHDAYGSESDDENPSTEDFEQLVTMKATEEAKTTPEALSAYKALLREGALERLDAAREDLKKHLNSITRRQYLYSTINVNLGGIDRLLGQAILNIARKLKPHKIINFRDGVNLKGKDKAAVTRIAERRWKKKIAPRIAWRKKVREKLHGEPLSEDARDFIVQLDFLPWRLYDYMEEKGLAYAKEMTTKKCHLVDVRFGVEYNAEANVDQKILLRLYGLVREEIEISTYQDYISGNRRGPYECKYYTVRGYSCYTNGDGFLEGQEEFIDSLQGIDEWTNNARNLPFTASRHGEVRQVHFSTTEDGRITFDFECGTTYDPELHPVPLNLFGHMFE